MNNNNRESSDNILAQLLSKAPEQLKKYCKLLDDKKRQDLYEEVLEEMRGNSEINYVKGLNKIATAIEDCYKDGKNKFIN